MPKIRVLSVDDSALIRQMLSKIVNEDPDLEMVGTAPHPIIAEKKIKELKPDVITLDIEMPEMDGVTFLKKIMLNNPIPVIMFSSLLEKHRELALDALTIGAFDYVVKPSANVSSDAARISEEIREKIKSAYYSKMKKIGKSTVVASETTKIKEPLARSTLNVTEKLLVDEILPMPKALPPRPSEKIIVIGSSTGGTEALINCLKKIEPSSPPIVIVQHMPEFFTSSFAKRMNSVLKIDVFEAEDGMKVGKGQAILARGGKHTLLKYKNGSYYVNVVDGPLITRHKPSVDVLFRSAAICAQKSATAIMLTGMGDDGARSMKEMHDLGSHCIAQDEKTCVVFGMPREAIARGAVDEVLPVDKIYEAALKYAR